MSIFVNFKRGYNSAELNIGWDYIYIYIYTLDGFIYTICVCTHLCIVYTALLRFTFEMMMDNSYVII